VNDQYSNGWSPKQQLQCCCVDSTSTNQPAHQVYLAGLLLPMCSFAPVHFIIVIGHALTVSIQVSPWLSVIHVIAAYGCQDLRAVTVAARSMPIAKNNEAASFDLCVVYRARTLGVKFELGFEVYFRLHGDVRSHFLRNRHLYIRLPNVMTIHSNAFGPCDALSCALPRLQYSDQVSLGLTLLLIKRPRIDILSPAVVCRQLRALRWRWDASRRCPSINFART
jgi:hypothetical protein